MKVATCRSGMTFPGADSKSSYRRERTIPIDDYRNIAITLIAAVVEIDVGCCHWTGANGKDDAGFTLLARVTMGSTEGFHMKSSRVLRSTNGLVGSDLPTGVNSCYKIELFFATDPNHFGRLCG